MRTMADYDDDNAWPIAPVPSGRDTDQRNQSPLQSPSRQAAVQPTPKTHDKPSNGSSHTDWADKLLEGLTEPQRQAVLHTDGPLLILAAAGSGKTRTVTRRIARLIADGVPPWQIMALTFTNKAAGEMRERALHLLGDQAGRSRGLTVTTFHALCARLLRKYADLAADDGQPLPVKGDYAIYDSADQLSLIKRVITQADLSTSNWPPRSVLGAISGEKNKLITAQGFAASANDFYSRTLAKLYTGYETALRQANAVDFDDLLLLTASMLKKSAAVRNECRQRWQYFMIDEYQDTNHAQFMIASMLAGDETADHRPNIAVVGDPDQAIYSWRGADIANIMEFEDQYPSARVITLGENFRSQAPILAVADTLIRHNKKRKHKDLFTSKAGGHPILVQRCRDERHEADLIVDWCKALSEGDEKLVGDSAKQHNWRDMAVFYRTNALSRSVEDAFRSAGVPYIVARGTAFYDREEVRNAIAYLRLVANQADDVSLRRIANVPTRGLGKASLDAIIDHAAHAKCAIMDSMQLAAQIEGVSPRAAASAEKFVQMIHDWTGGGTFMGASVGTTLAELVARVIDESGLREMYRKQESAEKSDGDASRVDNLDEVISSAAQFEEEYDPDADPVAFETPTQGADPATPTPPMLALLRAYLERVSLVADSDAIDPANGAVTLMTLHAAKGLEFPVVAMVGLEEGLLPHSRAAADEAATEEERRLCFVGITRAMEHLLITCASRRSHRGVPERAVSSRFLDELGSEHVVRTDMSDPYYDQSDDHGDTNDSIAVSSANRSGALTEAKSQFPVGSRVQHPRFGIGTIEALEGGASVRARVRFRDAGVKTLVLEYARLVPLR